MKCSCIQYYIRTQVHEPGADLRMIRYIEVSASKRMHIVRFKRSLQVLSKLSGGAEECDLHSVEIIIREAQSKTTLCRGDLDAFPATRITTSQNMSTRTM